MYKLILERIIKMVCGVLLFGGRTQWGLEGRQDNPLHFSQVTGNY